MALDRMTDHPLENTRTEIQPNIRDFLHDCDWSLRKRQIGGVLVFKIIGTLLTIHTGPPTVLTFGVEFFMDCIGPPWEHQASLL